MYADVSTHAPAREVPRTLKVLDSLLSQLAKENKKFVYGAVKSGGRAKEFEIAIQWLVDSHPGLHGVRFSLLPWREQEWVRNVPLYGVSGWIDGVNELFADA